MKKLIPRKNRTLGGVIMVVMMMFANACTNGKIQTMPQKTLWEVISVLEQQMPFTKASIEKSLGAELLETERDENFIQMTGTGPILRDGIVLSKLNLMLEPSMKFGERGAFAMELDGTCLSLTDIRQHFNDLELTQHPRGRSLQETTVWSARRAWGNLSFAFKAERPDCLARVSFRK